LFRSDEVSMFYDPMIAKLVTHGPNRLAAIDAQARALDEFVIEGIQDNIPFLGAVMEEKTFRSGKFTTAYIKEKFPDGFHGVAPTSEQSELLAAAAAYAHALSADRAKRVSGQVNGVRRPNGVWHITLGGARVEARVKLSEGGAFVSINEGESKEIASDWRPGLPVMAGSFAGAPFAVKIKPRGEGFHMRLRGVAANALVASARGAELHRRLPEKKPADTSKTILSPMPGLVVAVEVKQGQEVKAGESVAIVEAMKMQNIIRAERDGKVAKVNVAAGASVAADEVLVELA
ncbi:MAG: biotin/lipoyl-containing protein, partial [Hyphomonadaceae bacterium]